ncbi:hypothetical protein BM613_13205 [Sulfoacidibacillus thermotolerans]|uniref:Uncharacterized protein n=1 Tax=Sulfoacidibacillus thermotolerans TaxID=1765684 RepID=A0A2U3D439_SULT2|nr:hypothetical protein BM613_13205 [Sulfoacidibacillus thermotolerans]
MLLAAGLFFVAMAVIGFLIFGESIPHFFLFLNFSLWAVLASFFFRSAYHATVSSIVLSFYLPFVIPLLIFAIVLYFFAFWILND